MAPVTLRTRAMRLTLSAGLTGAVVLAVAACGSSSHAKTTAASTSSSGSAASTRVLPKYTGPEAGVPSSYAQPQTKPGTHFVLGYLNPSQGVQGLDEAQAAAQAEVKALGGTSIAYSINTSTQTQVAKFNDLLAQGVSAIVLQPQNPVALAPEIAKAHKKGVVLVAASTPADVPTPNLPGYVTNALQGVDQCAYDNAKAIAQAKPGATFVIMGSGLPYPSLQYLSSREQYWATKLGLKYVGRVNTGTGFLPPNGETAMNAIEARYPTADAVMAWADTVAEGAATTNRATHKSYMVTGANGDTPALALIKQGEMFATCENGWSDLGKEEAIAAYDEVTKQHLPLPTKIVIPVTEVTKSAG
jgi:ABC-type sugar transport system substrate-binding protein